MLSFRAPALVSSPYLESLFGIQKFKDDKKDRKDDDDVSYKHSHLGYSPCLVTNKTQLYIRMTAGYSLTSTTTITTGASLLSLYQSASLVASTS